MESIIKLLCEKVEMCQSKGAFSLKDAYILKDCVDLFVLGKSSNPEINQQNALDAIIQALNMGQSKGCFNLKEAHELYSNMKRLEELAQQQQEAQEQEQKEEEKSTEI